MELVVEDVRRLLTGKTEHNEPHVSDLAILQTLKQHNWILFSTRRDVDRHDTQLKLVQDESGLLRAFLEEARHAIERQSVELIKANGRLDVTEKTIEALQEKVSCLSFLEKTISNHNVQISTLQETASAMDLRSSKRFEAHEQSLSTVKMRMNTTEVTASRLEGRIDRLKEELLLPAYNVTLPTDLHAEARFTEGAVATEDQKSHLTHLLGAFRDQLETHEAAVEHHDKKLDDHTAAIRLKAKIDIEETICSHTSQLDLLQKKMEADSDCDIPSMLADLREAEMQLRNILEQLNSKVTYDDLSSNIESKYAEILAYLQSALRATEDDDGDLRQETKILRHALNEIRMTKADKGDLAQLRAQIASHKSRDSNTAEIAVIKEELELRPKHSEICKLLSNKVSFADLKTSLGLALPGVALGEHLHMQMPDRASVTAHGYPDWRRPNSESPFQPLKKAEKSADALIPLPQQLAAGGNADKPLYVSALPPPILPRVQRL